MIDTTAGDWLRPFGATGITVSAVCMGGAQLGSMPELFGYEVTEDAAIDLVTGVMDRLPIVFLHDPEFHPYATMTEPGGAVEALVELRDAGEIGHIGVAGGDTREIGRYLELGVFEAVLIHNRWTLVDRSAGPLFDRAHADGLAVVNAAVIGGGLLTETLVPGPEYWLDNNAPIVW